LEGGRDSGGNQNLEAVGIAEAKGVVAGGAGRKKGGEDGKWGVGVRQRVLSM